MRKKRGKSLMGAKLFIQKFSFLEKDRKKEKMSRLTSLGFEPEPSLSLDF